MVSCVGHRNTLYRLSPLFASSKANHKASLARCVDVFCSLDLKMVEFSISNVRYTYVHDQKYPSEVVDIHHIVSRRSNAKYYFVCGTTLAVLACALYLYVLTEKSISLVYYSFLFDIFLVKSLLGKLVNKESVVIMPAFGVQLETHYSSGKVIRYFIPIDKILKPVLIERVTPMTCYWTLSLIMREESEMLLVFKNLRPPVKMLVHVWKALCAATDSKEESCAHAE
ncbi:unnamed protein product [Sphenostylis stenocarpa]|uniref:Phosphatidylinositol N-acetylglucosaminyltransferase subunit H conserved domain-containing protein n=1 Tax=Sphenostylis stenocarpa TaxID=92480 RepID=A0AA86S1G9_9FABA|nr:unnamed protein product [Sphenostylis stenocarpa]